MESHLAFKFVAITAMLAEINFCSDRLHLPINSPVESTDAHVFFIPDPRMEVQTRHPTNAYVGLREKSDTGKERHGEIKQL